MAYVIYPNKCIKRVPHETLFDFFKRNGFCGVGFPHRFGYAIYVDDCGRIEGLPRNTVLEQFLGYGPIHGPAFVTSHEEAEETHLLSGIDPEEYTRVTAWLEALCSNQKAVEN